MHPLTDHEHRYIKSRERITSAVVHLTLRMIGLAIKRMEEIQTTLSGSADDLIEMALSVDVLAGDSFPVNPQEHIDSNSHVYSSATLIASRLVNIIATRLSRSTSDTVKWFASNPPSEDFLVKLLMTAHCRSVYFDTETMAQHLPGGKTVSVAAPLAYPSVGLALIPHANKIRQDCSPNSYIFVDGPGRVINSGAPITIERTFTLLPVTTLDPKTEVVVDWLSVGSNELGETEVKFIKYFVVEPVTHTAARQEALWRLFGRPIFDDVIRGNGSVKDGCKIEFPCDCARCLDPFEGGRLTRGIRCSKCLKGFCVPGMIKPNGSSCIFCLSRHLSGKQEVLSWRFSSGQWVCNKCGKCEADECSRLTGIDATSEFDAKRVWSLVPEFLYENAEQSTTKTTRDNQIVAARTILLQFVGEIDKDLHDNHWIRHRCYVLLGYLCSA